MLSLGMILSACAMLLSGAISTENSKNREDAKFRICLKSILQLGNTAVKVEKKEIQQNSTAKKEVFLSFFNDSFL